MKTIGSKSCANTKSFLRTSLNERMHLEECDDNKLSVICLRQSQPCSPCGTAQIQVPLADVTTDTVPDPATARRVSGKTMASADRARRAAGCWLCREELFLLRVLQKGFRGHGLSRTCQKKSPRTALEVTPSYSQLQRQPHKLAVGATTQTCSEGSSGNTSVSELGGETEQSVTNRNCCPPSPKKQQTHNSSDSWMNQF